MSKSKIGEDSPIPKFVYLKIRRRDGIKYLMTLEDGEFKVPIDSWISCKLNLVSFEFHLLKTFFGFIIPKLVF